MSTDDTSSILLGDSTLGYLRRRGEEELYDEGEVILRKGVSGSDLYVVLEGEVEVRIEEASGRHLPLCRMGPGATFGEMSILRGAPASADVVAMATTRVLRYPADAFPTAMAECEALRQKLLKRLATNLHRTTRDAWGLFRKAEALTSLVRGEGGSATMVAVSASMKAVLRRVSEVAGSAAPVLINGESGTGKLRVARRIHEESERRKGPLIVVDCQRLVPAEARTLLFGPASGDVEPDEPESQGALHLAHSGTLVLRNIQVLRLDLQHELSRYLDRALTAGSRSYPDTRVIATSRGADQDGTSRVVDRLRSLLR